MVRQLKKRKAASSSSLDSSATSHARHRSFEKRCRHKTRDDRYELKKEKHKSAKHDGQRQPRRNREKKGDKKRASRKAGEDLMHKFSSEKVSEDRLTVSNSWSIVLHKLTRPDPSSRTWTISQWSGFFSSSATWQ